MTRSPSATRSLAGVSFTKAHGAGNDFVLLPDLDDRLDVTPEVVRALCARHTGLGADGVIRIGGPREGADVFMDYRNADGSVAETCGNGIRCVAKYVLDRDLVGGAADALAVSTRTGVKTVTVTRDDGGRVGAATVDMGLAVPLKVALALDVAGHGTVEVTTLSMGNPHAVVVVDDVATAPLATLGAAVAAHEEFPDGTNVEMIRAVAHDRVEARILERGVGETRASGSGAAAVAAAAHLLGRTGRSVRVALPGGDLDVVSDDDGLWVTGPAVEVATGNLDESWFERIA